MNHKEISAILWSTILYEKPRKMLNILYKPTSLFNKPTMLYQKVPFVNQLHNDKPKINLVKQIVMNGSLM